jgi:hypothetical protein
MAWFVRIMNDRPGDGPCSAIIAAVKSSLINDFALSAVSRLLRLRLGRWRNRRQQDG